MIIDNFEMPDIAPMVKGSRTTYPIKALQVGQGFSVAIDDQKQKSLNSLVSRFKRLNPAVVLDMRRADGVTYIRREA